MQFQLRHWKVLLVVGDQREFVNDADGSYRYVCQRECLPFPTPLAKELTGKLGDFPGDRVELEFGKKSPGSFGLVRSQAHV